MDKDWLLEFLISALAQTGGPITITLSVGGTVVSGDLATEREYFEKMASVIRMSGDPSSGDAFARLPYARDEAAMRLLDEGADPEEAW